MKAPHTIQFLSHLPRAWRRLLLASPALLGGCALYVPTLPATPLVEKGQVEIVGSTRLVGTLGLSAAWAPTPHLLVLGEGAFQDGGKGHVTTNQGTEISYRDYHRQASLGLGYYRAPTASSSLYLAAVGGVGFASANLHAIDFGFASPWLPIPLPYYAGQYRADYRRYYGQLYLAKPRPQGFTVGGALRGSVADYTRLTLDGYSISPNNHVFLEPLFFLRHGQGPLQMQLYAGLSLPLAGNRNDPANFRTAPVSSLVGFGLVFRPDLLKRKQ